MLVAFEIVLQWSSTAVAGAVGLGSSPVVVLHPSQWVIWTNIAKCR